MLSMMKVLIRTIEKSYIIVNITHLSVHSWTTWKSIDLYNVINHFLVFTALNNNRGYKSIALKTYQKPL